jgi:homocysteine S-methyltransferase
VSERSRRSITIAQEAFNTTLIHSEGRVVLSLGAYGATMIPGQEYTGAYDSSHSTIAQLRDWHLERIRAFVSFGKGRDGDVEEGEVKEKRECWELVDLVAFETLPLLREVLAVQEVMFQVSSALGEKEMNPFWISCVFPGSANTLPDGSSIKDVVKAMLGKRETCATPMGIGLNCTKIGKLEGLIEEFEREVIAMMERGELEEEWPALVVYPDGTNGEVYNTTTQEWEKKEVGVENRARIFYFDCCAI